MAINSDVNATMAMAPAGLRGVHNDDTAAVSRSLAARAAHPGQTPVLRRTGVLAPVPEPKPKKNVFATVFVALLLLGVIGYCANKLRPIYDDVRQQHRPTGAASTTEAASLPPATDPATAQNDGASNAGAESSAENADAAAPDANSKDAVAPATPPVLDVKSARVEKAPPKRPNPFLPAKGAESKARTEGRSPNEGWALGARFKGFGTS